jgi:hypothetical protein
LGGRPGVPLFKGGPPRVPLLGRLVPPRLPKKGMWGNVSPGVPPSRGREKCEGRVPVEHWFLVWFLLPKMDPNGFEDGSVSKLNIHSLISKFVCLIMKLVCLLNISREHCMIDFHNGNYIFWRIFVGVGNHE